MNLALFGQRSECPGTWRMAQRETELQVGIACKRLSCEEKEGEGRINMKSLKILDTRSGF